MLASRTGAGLVEEPLPLRHGMHGVAVNRPMTHRVLTVRSHARFLQPAWP
jgi:hypothetical protein